MRQTGVLANAGEFGPLRLYTSTTEKENLHNNQIIIDDNPNFGDIKISDPPETITVQISRDFQDENAYYSSQISTVTLSIRTVL